MVHVIIHTYINILGDVNWVSRSEILDQSLPKIAFFGGKSGKIGKNREILEKIEKGYIKQVSIIKRNILAKFHQERTIFDEIRGHLLIFYLNMVVQTW